MIDLSSSSPLQPHAHLATYSEIFGFAFVFCLGIYMLLPTSCSLACCFLSFFLKSLQGWFLLIVQALAQRAF